MAVWEKSEFCLLLHRQNLFMNDSACRLCTTQSGYRMFAALWIKNWACRVSDFLQFDLWERVLGAAFRLRAELPPNKSCYGFVFHVCLEPGIGDMVHR